MSIQEKIPESGEIDIVDDKQAPELTTGPFWRVLIVDDDEEIHEVTRYALRDTLILGRPVELIHVYTAQEALQRIEEFSDVAVALVDVVMETPNSGLDLVTKLRAAGLSEMRIILRTGQPGYAPELSVIAKYEINDYRTKVELTHTRLITVLISAIRAYNQISTINRSREGLEMIVESSSELFKRSNLQLFCWGVLTQISALMNSPASGMVYITKTEGHIANSIIISATGRFCPYVRQPVDSIGDRRLLKTLEFASDKRGDLVENGCFVLKICGLEDHELVALIEIGDDVADTELSLLKLFSDNITIAFENLALLERMEYLAFTDPVLDIPNANAFEEALYDAIERRRTGGNGTRVSLIAVEDYPNIMADNGPLVAFEYLKAVYEALRAGKSPPLVARISDNVLALLGNDTSITKEKVEQPFTRTYRVLGMDIASSACSVIVDIDPKSGGPHEIMHTAHAELSHARRTGQTGCVSDGNSVKSIEKRRSILERGLEQALKQGDGFTILLQPQFDLMNNRVIGAEALLRWNLDEEHVAPNEFLPIAKAKGLTQNLTEFVITTLGHWNKDRGGHKQIPVAVNLSMNDLNLPGFAARLTQWVSNAGLSPETIQFEISEGMGLHERACALQEITNLRNAGFRIALDDFGTGYSSLGHFDRLPIDVLKIDRSFISDLTTGTAPYSLAYIALAMSQALKIDCIAEGIENEEQMQALTLLGYTVGQGYLLARPMPFQEFEKLIAAH